MPCAGGLVQYVWEAEVVNWTGLLTNSTHSTAKNGAPSPLFSFLFLRRAEEWRVDFTQRRVK